MIDIFIDNKIINIPQNELKFINKGGESRIYRWRDLVLKFHFDPILNTKARVIKKRFTENKTNLKIPFSLLKRSTLVGHGFCSTNDLHLRFESPVYILIFNWLEGKQIDNNDPKLNLKQRKSLYHQILEGLAFLERIGIVHFDLMPKNFIIDKDFKTHFIDIESAGLLIWDRIHTQWRDDWEFKPSVLGTYDYDYGNPPEKQENFLVVNRYTSYWSGLVFLYNLLHKESPFFFLTKRNIASLTELKKIANQDFIKEWPPLGIENHPYFNNFVSIEHILQVREQLNSTPFEQRIKTVLYKTFIKGLNYPHERISFINLWEIFSSLPND